MSYWMVRAGDRLVVWAAEGYAAVAVVEEDGTVRAEAACPPGDPIPVFAPDLPREPGPLAKEQYDRISIEVERRARGRREIPLGTPPTEAERPPKIPAKVRRRRPET